MNDERMAHAKALLEKVAALADQELPIGYQLELTLQRIGDTTEIYTIIVAQISSPESRGSSGVSV
jgi:hypothetical protein